MKDPYSVLGVAKTASEDQIKKTYRQLARSLHPDVNPGDAKAEERFKEITAAYDFLSDPVRRGQFDRGEIDATGAAKRPRWRAHSQQGGGGRRPGGFDFGGNVDDILAEMLRRKDRGRQQAGGGNRGADMRIALAVSFVEAINGATRRVTLGNGRAVDVKVPAGAVSGQSLRLKGQGNPGIGGDGDAYVDITVEAHPFFTKRDLDLLLTLPISVQEAVMGGKVTVPTIDGKVVVTIPPGSNSGGVLRLKGKGLAGPNGRGDQLVTLQVVLPDNDPEFRKAVEKWGPRHGYDPRARAGMV